VRNPDGVFCKSLTGVIASKQRRFRSAKTIFFTAHMTRAKLTEQQKNLTIRFQMQIRNLPDELLSNFEYTTSEQIVPDLMAAIWKLIDARRSGLAGGMSYEKRCH
jgi:hypothetical protein